MTAIAPKMPDFDNEEDLHRWLSERKRIDSQDKRDQGRARVPILGEKMPEFDNEEDVHRWIQARRRRQAAEGRNE